MRIPKQDQRRMIMEKALEFVKKGTYKNLSVRDFCADAGITTGVFYRNFLSKETLFHDCCSQLLEEELSTVEVLLFGLSCEEQLIRYGLFLLSFSRKVGQEQVMIDMNDLETIRTYEDCRDMAAKYAMDILLRASTEHLIDRASVALALESFFVVIEGTCMASHKWKFEREEAVAYEEQLLRWMIPGILGYNHVP